MQDDANTIAVVGGKNETDGGAVKISFYLTNNIISP